MMRIHIFKAGLANAPRFVKTRRPVTFSRPVNGWLSWRFRSQFLGKTITDFTCFPMRSRTLAYSIYYLILSYILPLFQQKHRLVNLWREWKFWSSQWAPQQLLRWIKSRPQDPKNLPSRNVSPKMDGWKIGWIWKLTSKIGGPIAKLIFFIHNHPTDLIHKAFPVHLWVSNRSDSSPFNTKDTALGIRMLHQWGQHCDQTLIFKALTWHK